MKKNIFLYKMAIGGLILVMVLVVAMGFRSARKPANEVIEIAARQSTEIVRNVSHKVQVVLAKEVNLASTVASDRGVVDAADRVKLAGTAVAGSEIGAANTYLEQVMKNANGNYEGLALLNADGGVITSVRGGLDPGRGASSREAFNTAKTGKVGIGSPVKSEKTGSVVVQICAPVFNARGEFVGGINAMVNIGFLIDRINSTKFGETGYAFMVDRKGTVIAHPRQDLMLGMNLIAEEELKNVGHGMISQKKGTEFYTYRGEKRHIGFAPVELAGWSVGFTRNTAEMTASSRSTGYTLGLMGIILLCIALAAAIPLHPRRFASPVDPAVTSVCMRG